MQPRPPFRPENMRYAYQLNYHLGFRTKYREPIFKSAARRSAFEDILSDTCRRNHYHLLESELDDVFARVLLSLRPTHAPAKVVQTMKANLSRHLFEAFPEIESVMRQRHLWSRGYYFRSVGHAPAAAIRGYLQGQQQHHEVEKQNSRLLARYAHPSSEPYYELRPLAHCMVEYNCHFVFSPVGHVHAMEEGHARDLLRYMRRVASAREFVILELEILSDHVHLFAALNPSQSPEEVALTVMNNTHHWFAEKDPAVFKAWDVPGFWQCSAFVRTAGAATTAQVSSFLRGRAETGG